MASVTRGTRPAQERRVSVRERILDATAKLLRDGERFTAIPVERILTDADVSRSSFYVHFPDKPALLAALGETATDDVAASARTWWEHDHSEGPRGVEPVIREMLKTYRTHAGVLQAIAEVAAYDEDVRRTWRDQQTQFVRATDEWMKREIKAGRITLEKGVDSLRTWYAVTTMIDTVLRDHVAYGAAKDDRALARALARAGWLAVYGRVPARA